METTQASVEDVARMLEHARERSEALLEVLRALQKTFPTDRDDLGLTETLSSLIIMRTRLNERQVGLTELLSKAAKQQDISAVVVADDVAEQLGLK
jgi:hypothetical protein